MRWIAATSRSATAARQECQGLPTSTIFMTAETGVAHCYVLYIGFPPCCLQLVAESKDQGVPSLCSRQPQQNY